MMLNSFKEYNFEFFYMMGKYFSRKEIAKEMDTQLYSNPLMTWYILYESVDNVYGFISIEKKKDYYYIDNFYVLKEYRNKGYGKKILSKVIEKYGNYKIKLITRNEIAKKLYEEFDFEVISKNGRYFKMAR